MASTCSGRPPRRELLADPSCLFAIPVDAPEAGPETWAPIADAVYLLHREKRSLVRIGPEALAGLGAELEGSTASRDEVSEGPAPLGRRAAGAVRTALDGTAGIVEQALATAPFVLPWWRSPRWGLRYLRHYIGLLASPSSWLYFGAAGAVGKFDSALLGRDAQRRCKGKVARHHDAAFDSSRRARVFDEGDDMVP